MLTLALLSPAIVISMHPGYCPQCGERVTPFAAGCALCGADLDPRRWQQPPTLWQRLTRRARSVSRPPRARRRLRVRRS
jgi:predicted amidophosphoribosyltransferase